MVIDPSIFDRTGHADNLPETLKRLFENAEKGLGAALEDISEQAVSLDSSLQQTVESTKRKVWSQLNRLREVIGRKAADQSLPGLPKAGVAREFLRPRGRLQERVLNMCCPFVLAGTPVKSQLFQVARAQLDGCFKGEFSHSVLRIKED
jgi:hypothetical protein